MNEILQGHVIDKLRIIPPKKVNCIVTSPPYWGLRAYKTEPQIWGGRADCEHRWGEEITEKTDITGYIRHRKGLNKAAEMSDGHKRSSMITPDILERKSNFCQLCGAWRGELGLEPTIELYIEHLMMVFDECKRVLRDDGICFVNLGDTYSGSGGAGGDWNKGKRAKEPKWRQGRVTQAELDADAKRAKDKNYSTQAFAGYPGWDRNTIKPSNIPQKSLCGQKKLLGWQQW